MSYRLSDPVEIKEGGIVVRCGECSDEIGVSLSEFRETWQDADESTVVSYKCRECSRTTERR